MVVYKWCWIKFNTIEIKCWSGCLFAVASEGMSGTVIIWTGPEGCKIHLGEEWSQESICHLYNQAPYYGISGPSWVEMTWQWKEVSGYDGLFQHHSQPSLESAVNLL